MVINDNISNGLLYIFISDGPIHVYIVQGSFSSGIIFCRLPTPHGEDVKARCVDNKCSKDGGQQPRPSNDENWDEGGKAELGGKVCRIVSDAHPFCGGIFRL